MKKLICTVVLALASACGRPDVQLEVTAHMDAWGDAFNAHDVNALAALYSDDVDYTYTFEGQEGRGKDSLQAFYGQAFTMTPDISVERKSYEIIEIDDGIAWGTGEFVDTFTGPMGQVVAPTHASEVLIRINGKQLVRADHASFVPPPMGP